MRSWPFAVCALAVLAFPTAAAGGSPSTGGTAAPAGGGTVFAQPIDGRPVATEFAVTPGRLVAGAPATFTFRVDAPTRKVRVRIELTRPGRTAPVVRLRLGYVRAGVRHTHRWTPGVLAAGRYGVALHAFDDRGHALKRTASASGRTRVVVEVAAPPPAAVTAAGVFPIAGPYSFGGEEARFGAGRDGHIHQGQDLMAANGTPLVAPVAATVYWIAFQRDGAGHYVVLRGADGRDYVFMHLLEGSITVARGTALAAGAQFAQVGNSGSSSGPHLHFEIWPDGWYSSKDSAPIDPLPQLQAWATASSG